MTPAGDFDYDRHGHSYTARRQADPRIEAQVHRALGDARRVLNVGAGAGSYEPTDRLVVAVEPSAAMRAQRPAHRVPAIDGRAEALPFDDGAFEASMAMVTVHQWEDLDAGLGEMRRVTSGPVVIMTFDRHELRRLWIFDYVPELFAVDHRRYPELDHVAGVLGGTVEVQEVPIPLDCVDGFAEAFYGRPEQFLEPEVRRNQSAWQFVDPAAVERGMAALAADLESGAWDGRYGHLRTQAEFVGSVRLLVSRPG